MRLTRELTVIPDSRLWCEVPPLDALRARALEMQ
jgi:hypothetical protein